MFDLSDILRDKEEIVVSVSPETPVREAARVMADHEIGVVTVIDDEGRVRGILSERDVSASVARFGGAIAGKTAGDLMTAPVISCSSNDSLVEIVVLMEEHHIRHLPVIDDGHLVAMISMRDIQSAWLDALDQECETLRGAKAA